MTGKHRSGRPVDVSNPALETRIDTLIQEDRCFIVERVAEELQVSVGTVHNIISQKLKYRKTSARWVPRELTDHPKRLDFEHVRSLNNAICRKVILFWIEF